MTSNFFIHRAELYLQDGLQFERSQVQRPRTSYFLFINNLFKVVGFAMISFDKKYLKNVTVSFKDTFSCHPFKNFGFFFKENCNTG